MRSTLPLRSAPSIGLALMLAVIAVLASGPTSPTSAASLPQVQAAAFATTTATATATTGTTSTPSVVVRGCTAFAGARALGHYYADARVRVYPCGMRPSWDGARTGSGPVVRPFAGSTIYYRGYQCIELVARYLKARFNADPGVANGAQAVDRYASAYPARFVRIANGTRWRAPRKGDVLSLSRTWDFSGVGHTGIVSWSTVSSAGNGTIGAIEENWGGIGGSTGYHNYPVRNWRVVYPGLPYVKWLHAL